MHSKVWPIILLALPSIIRAPTLASVPDRLTSATQSMTVPPAPSSDSVMLAFASTALPGAWPCALMTARSGATSSANSMFTLNLALMNPTPTLAAALKWVSSMTSIDSTPGPHCPTCAGSMTNAQTFCRDALIGTEPSKCMGPPAPGYRSVVHRRVFVGRQVRRRLLDEPGPAPDGAERVDDAVVIGEVPGVSALDRHAADRIDQDDVVNDGFECDRLRDDAGDRCGAWRRDEVGAASADLDELGKDRQGHLFGRLGTDIHPGRRPQRADPLVTDRCLLAKPLANDSPTRRGRDEAHVRGLTRERKADGLLVPDALARDDDIRRGVGVEPADVGRCVDAFCARERVGVGDRVDDGHSPAGRRAKRRERAGDRGRPDDPEEWCGQMRFHVDLQRAPRVAGHDELDDAVGPPSLARTVLRQPKEPRLAIADRPQRLADDDRLGAAAADPALDRAVGEDDAGRARPGRGRTPDG